MLQLDQSEMSNAVSNNTTYKVVVSLPGSEKREQLHIRQGYVQVRRIVAYKISA